MQIRNILGAALFTICSLAMFGIAQAQQAPPAESAECAMRVERINTLTSELKDLQTRNLEIVKQRDEAARAVQAEKAKHRDAMETMLRIVNQKNKSEKQRLSEVGTSILTEE